MQSYGKGEREDGRSFDQYRELTIETNVINKAEGSARVKLGDTHVVVGVKCQPGTPFPITPDQGVIITNLELIPLASPVSNPAPPGRRHRTGARSGQRHQGIAIC